ncbi:response regulator [bacterium]|nr:response regulator [bacterium]
MKKTDNSTSAKVTKKSTPSEIRHLKSAFNIMVVDDDPSITLQISAVLKKHDFACTVFNDPVLAMQDFLKNPYHLLITDISMPYIDGFELIKRLHLKRPSCYFIVVTSLNTLEVVSRSQRCGATYIFLKPVKPNELAKAIKTMYSRHRYWLDMVQTFNPEEKV